MGCWSTLIFVFVITFVFVILFIFVFVLLFALLGNNARQRDCDMLPAYRNGLMFNIDIYIFICICICICIQFIFLFVFLFVSIFLFALEGNDAGQRNCDILAGIPQWAAGQY